MKPTSHPSGAGRMKIPGHVLTSSAAETESAGAELAALVSSGEVLLLTGPLGAGKTTFARGFVHALGYSGPVRSPSYTLLNRYPSNPPVSHLDLYRLNDLTDLVALDLEGETESRILLIEWGDRFENMGRHADWSVHIQPESPPSERRIIQIARFNG